MRKNNKGQMTPLSITLLIILGVLLVGGVTWGVTVGYQGNSLSVIASEYDGEFDDSSLPEEVGGTDLIANTSWAVANEAFTVAYESDVDLNGTDGNNHAFAFNFEVAGGDVEDFDAGIELGATIATTELQLKNAYVMRDEKGLTLDSSNADASFIVSVDTDLDKIDIEAAYVADGEYILVVEAKSLATVTIADGELLFTVDVDAQSDDSDATDEGVVSVYNFI